MFGIIKDENGDFLGCEDDDIGDSYTEADVSLFSRWSEDDQVYEDDNGGIPHFRD